MIDLTRLNMLLDAIANCQGRSCQYCRDLYETRMCPLSEFKNVAKKAHIAIEKCLNNQHESIITEEMFMDILTEFNNA